MGKKRPDKLSPESKAKIIAIARTLSLAPGQALALSLLRAMDKALYGNTEAGEAITEDEQIMAAVKALEFVAQDLRAVKELAEKSARNEAKAGEVATDAIQRAIRAAKEEKAARGEKKEEPPFNLPPGGIIAPGSDSVN